MGNRIFRRAGAPILGFRRRFLSGTAFKLIAKEFELIPRVK